MLGFMSERLSSWEKIKQSGREVVVYGMGNGADKVLDEFARLDIKVRGVTASSMWRRLSLTMLSMSVHSTNSSLIRKKTSSRSCPTIR